MEGEETGRAWEHTSLSPALRKLRLELSDFQASLVYTGRPCLYEGEGQWLDKLVSAQSDGNLGHL